MLDQATNVAGGGGPVPGAITICEKCLGVSQFDNELKMKRVDWDRLPVDFRERLRVVIRLARAGREGARIHQKLKHL
jgi:hypothetical protein